MTLWLYMKSWCHSCDITSCHLICTQQHLGFIQSESTGLYFGERESWALPSSPLCVAVVTHSSPGPKLPQSNTASLRTLVYASAAKQGSGGGGDSRWEIQLYTHVQTHNRHITSVCHLSGVHPVSNLIRARSVTGVSTQTGTGNLLFNPLWHLSEAHTTVKMGNGWLSLFKRIMPCTHLTRWFKRCRFKRFKFAERLSKQSSLFWINLITSYRSTAKKRFWVTISDLSLVKPVVTVLRNDIFRQHEPTSSTQNFQILMAWKMITKDVIPVHLDAFSFYKRNHTSRHFLSFACFHSCTLIYFSRTEEIPQVTRLPFSPPVMWLNAKSEAWRWSYGWGNYKHKYLCLYLHTH